MSERVQDLRHGLLEAGLDDNRLARRLRVLLPIGQERRELPLQVLLLRRQHRHVLLPLRLLPQGHGRGGSHRGQPQGVR